ncbi:MAG: eL32 family ribosomal protein [Candidatus Micrarchaeota archaeon]
METIRKQKKKKARFTRPNYGTPNRKRVKSGWKRPRGIDNKKKRKVKARGKEPNIGWRNARKIRGIHPSGSYEMLVRNLNDFDDIKGRLVRIASSVGKKKRALIKRKAEELKLTVLNG